MTTENDKRYLKNNRLLMFGPLILLFAIPTSILMMGLFQPNSSDVLNEVANVKAVVDENKTTVEANEASQQILQKNQARIQAAIDELREEVRLKTIDRLYLSEFERWKDSLKKQNKELTIPDVPDVSPELIKEKDQ